MAVCECEQRIAWEIAERRGAHKPVGFQSLRDKILSRHTPSRFLSCLVSHTADTVLYQLGNVLGACGS